MNIKNPSKFLGVRFRESLTRPYFKGQRDKYYFIRFKKNGHNMEEGVGWASAGMTPQCASNLRSQIVQNIRTGQGFGCLKEKRELQALKEAEKKEAEQTLEKENTPFYMLALKYLEWAAENKKSWRDDASRYRIHIAPVLGAIPLKNISTLDLDRLKSILKKKRNVLSKKKNPPKDAPTRPLSEATIKHCLVLVRQIFNRGISWKMYDRTNPVTIAAKENRKLLKIANNERERFLSREEATSLLEELRKDSGNKINNKQRQQIHNICQLSLLTGMRMGEVFNLKWGDIDLIHDVIRIKDPKNNKPRSAYITPPLREIFEGLQEGGLKKSQLVFPNGKGGKYQELSNIFGRIVDKLEFNKDVVDTRDKVVPHTLRHTFGSWLAMYGEPIITIQKLMGHKDLSMTLRYAHLSPSHEREAANRLAQNQPEKVIPVKKRKKK